MENWVAILVKWMVVFLVIFLLFMVLVSTLMALGKKRVAEKTSQPAYLYY